MERFNFEDLGADDENVHSDIRDIESKLKSYQDWNEMANNIINKASYYKGLYEKSKSKYAKEKFESLYNKSIVLSDKAIENNSHSIDSWYNKGLALSNLGQYEKAIECYDRIIEIDPDYFPVWNIKGNALNYLGKLHEAIKAYNQVLEKDPKNIIAFYNKGLALSNLGQYEKAIECYERIIEIDSNNKDALNAKGLAFARLDKYDEAIACYDRVLEKDPNNIDALTGKGYALQRLRKHKEAKQYYNKVSETYLAEIKEMNEKAKEYQESGKYDEAIICYDRIISIEANNSNAWLKKGILLYNLDKYYEAIECYDRIIGLDKFKEKLKKDGQELSDKQVTEYYKTIKSDPDYIEALNAKGYALEKIAKYKDAIQIFDVVISQNPNFVIETILKKGDTYMKLGNEDPRNRNYQAAEKSYKDALQHDSNNISALNKLHTLYSNYTFHYDKAISICKQLLSLSASQIQSNEKLNNNIDIKNQRKKLINYISLRGLQGKKVQTMQTNLLNEENILNTKISLSEDYIKNGNYSQGRKTAKDTLKETPSNSIKRQLIIRFLIIASYLLERKKDEGFSNLDKILTYYINLDIPVTIAEDQWNFKGLINTINNNKDIDGPTKTILRNLIDVLRHGFTDSYKILSKFTAETIEKTEKIKKHKKIKQAIIIPIIVVAIVGTLSFVIFTNTVVSYSCTVHGSQVQNLGNDAFAIEFNPTTNKAYITTSRDKTISVLDCNNSLYNNLFKTNTGIEKERTISLTNPIFDIAINPNTNKIYAIHQTPSDSPSLTVIDGNNNNILKNNIPIGNSPVDVAVNTNTSKVYVANYGDNTVSVIDGNTYQVINGSIVVGARAMSISVNPNTNKVYVTNEGSNNVTVIEEKEQNHNIKSIPLSYYPADININTKNNKVYVTHPNDNTVSVIDGIHDKKINEIDVGEKPLKIDIDENTDKVFVINRGSNSISVIDSTSDTILKTIKIPNDKLYDIEFIPELNSLVVTNIGSFGNIVNVINYNDAKYDSYIHVGNKPVDIDVNPKTNKSYIINYESGTLSIINSKNKEEQEIDVGNKPVGVAVNPNTNKIYVIHQTPSDSPSLTVIDGNNNNILKNNIPIGNSPVDVAVNTNTSKVYVANYGDNTVSVIDGNTYQVINGSIAVGNKPLSIAVNSETNKIYVTNKGSDTVSVIDGKRDQVINKPIDVDEEPFSIAVNLNTNKIYVGYNNNFHYSVIDGKDDKLLVDKLNEPTKINVNYKCPSDISINQEKNYAYVSFDCQDDLFLISESNRGIPLTTNTLGTNNTSIAFNSGTDKIYVIDTESDMVYVKDESELT